MKTEIRYTDGRVEAVKSVQVAEEILEGNVIAEDWNTWGYDGRRKLVWASDQDADGDDGANAMAEIVQRP